MDSIRETEIGDYAAIADTFAVLARHAGELTLCFEDAPIHYPVSVVAIDRSLGTCLIDITSLGDIEPALLLDRAFVVHAPRADGVVLRAAMRAREILHRPNRWGLRCDLPERLIASRRRADFRAALVEGMDVEVILEAGGRRWRAALRDMSVGGCRLSLPVARAAGLGAGEARYRLKARFANGQIFAAVSRVRHLHIDEDRRLAFVGIAFDIGLHDDERALWFYVREIERESARQTRKRPELRPLAVSRLFTDKNTP